MQLTIGRLAAASDVNVETIRYYNRRGILAEPERHAGGHRHYNAQHLKRVRFIKRAQALGFTLNEIADLLDLAEDCSCASMRDRAVQKRTLIDGKIADLTAIREALDALVRQCDTSGGDADCPILNALQREE
ncbi:MAG: MerR family transcriptional regulator [Steroidobacteraceae bacterium]